MVRQAHHDINGLYFMSWFDKLTMTQIGATSCHPELVEGWHALILHFADVDHFMTSP